MKKILIASIVSIFLTFPMFFQSFATEKASSSVPGDLSQVTRFVNEMLEKMPQSVSVEEVYDDESAYQYIEDFFGVENLARYSITFKINYLPGINGSSVDPDGANGTIWATFYADEKFITNHFIDVIPQKYDTNITNILKNYMEQWESAISPLKINGISMEQANTLNGVRNYILSLAPEDNTGRIEFQVAVPLSLPGVSDDLAFSPAIAGTRHDIDGKNGWFFGSLYVVDMQDKFYNREIKEIGKIEIIPTLYTGTSNSSGGNSSSDGSNYSYSSEPAGMEIHKSHVQDGKWKDYNGKWKLQIDDGKYANSQWGHVDNKWYLFGKDDYMLTGWQMVNNKWYYLNTSGDMATGWIKLNNIWYWLNDSGEMATKWRKIQDKWYYFGTNGAMWYNKTTPDGYYVSQDGAWLQ